MSLKQPLTDAQADVHMEEWALIAQEVGFEALSAAVREVMRNDTEWFPSVKAIRERAGVNREQQDDAEARRAWDALMAYVDKYVTSDVHGNYAPGRDCPLSQRILDTVRRSGGWQVYKCMTKGDSPFQQDRFFKEYRAWERVEGVEANRVLTAGGMDVQFRRLAEGKRMAEPASCAPTERDPATEQDWEDLHNRFAQVVKKGQTQSSSTRPSSFVPAVTREQEQAIITDHIARVKERHV